MDETYIEILNENGKPRIVSLDRAIKLTKQQVAREDREIGLHHKQISVRLITTPDHPESEHHTWLARAIERLSTFSVSACESSRALMMRCIRCYGNARMKLHRLCPLINS